MVPIDDNSFWRYNIAMRRPERVATPNTNRPPSLDGRARSPYVQPTTTANGIIQREWVAENDYQIDREFQKTEAFSGIRDFVSQDLAVTESMGPIYDRRKEHLGTTDKAIIALRRLLIRTALEMEDGVEPPAVDPELPYRSIRSAEKILDRGEDWRYLGTEADPILRNG
jgi:hypothetical protein